MKNIKIISLILSLVLTSAFVFAQSNFPSGITVGGSLSGGGYSGFIRASSNDLSLSNIYGGPAASAGIDILSTPGNMMGAAGLTFSTMNGGKVTFQTTFTWAQQQLIW